MLSVDSFWRFALQHYQQDAVKKSCLWLQDHYCLNVNVLLLCGYLHKLGLTYGDDVFKLLSEAIAGSEQQLILMRQSRRALKNQNKQSYELALKNELEIEKQQQIKLIDYLVKNSPELQQGDNYVQYLIAQKIDLNNPEVADCIAILKTTSQNM